MSELILETADLPRFPIAVVNHNVALPSAPIVTLAANDNEGSRVTGFVSSGLPVGTVKWLHNLGPRLDAGVIVLMHDDPGSVEENRILCPNHRPLLIPQQGAACIQLLEALDYDTQQIKRRWHVASVASRQLHLNTHSLGYYPTLWLSPISGEFDAWVPQVANAGNVTYTSGLGIAGVSLRPHDATKWVMSTVDASGATIRGMHWEPHASATDAAWHGITHEIYNAGPGPVTWRANVAGVVNDRIKTPGMLDYTQPVGARWSLHSEMGGGWSLGPTGTQLQQSVQDLTVTRSLSRPVTSDSAAISLSAGSTYTNWDPGSAAGQPTSCGVRITVVADPQIPLAIEATLESMVGPGAGKWRNGEFFIRNFGPLNLRIKHNVGASGARFMLPGGLDRVLSRWESIRLSYDVTGKYLVL